MITTEIFSKDNGTTMALRSKTGLTDGRTAFKHRKSLALVTLSFDLAILLLFSFLFLLNLLGIYPLPPY